MDNNIKFYNNFINQLSTENVRHRRIYQSLDMLPKGNVLDIGCGCGLSSKRLADGDRNVIALDYSDKAIDYARKNNNHEKIEYVCSDILDFETDVKFDSICLIDIIEHLHENTVNDIIKLIDQCSKPSTIIYINIPYNYTLRYLINTKFKGLQPIEKPYSIKDLMNIFIGIDYIPFKMELYWVQYVEMFFCKTSSFNDTMRIIYNTNTGA